MPERPLADGLTGAVPRQLPGPGPGPAAARAAMVARLEQEGALHRGPVREALLAIPREVLMPQGYVRRTELYEAPVQWQLLDWAVPADRAEFLDVLHCGESVLIQHDGEPILGRESGVRRTGVSRKTLDLGRAIEARYRPLKTNYCTLGNVLPHFHTRDPAVRGRGRPWPGRPPAFHVPRRRPPAGETTPARRGRLPLAPHRPGDLTSPAAMRTRGGTGSGKCSDVTRSRATALSRRYPRSAQVIDKGVDA
ncbi:hypothetical protein EES41_36385 [Streptomyces sp. ADI95-16]|nr:hypothetical protein EES41_36385 [Streptomyces sp. ADI95-16]